MTADEAVERFSAAYDGQLSVEEQRAFDAALRESESLRAEYGDFCGLLQETHRLALDEDSAPDLLSSVQEKLRSRSRGRFYRDRFARQSGRSAWALMMVAAAMFVVVVLAWFLMSYVEVQTPSSPDRDVPTSSDR